MSAGALRRAATASVGLAVVALLGSGLPASAAVHLAAGKAGATSSGFAGYQVEKAKTHIKSLSADFVVPHITCRKNFSGVGPAIIMQSPVNKKTNTFKTTAAGVGVGCEHKAPVLQSIIAIDGFSHNDFMISEGDHVTVTIRAVPTVRVTVDDTTSHQSKTRTGKKFTAVIGQIGCNALTINKRGVGLDPFTKIKATSARVNGKPVGAEKPSRVTWINAKHPKHVLVTASKLADRDAFSMTFKNSQ